MFIVQFVLRRRMKVGLLYQRAVYKLQFGV